MGSDHFYTVNPAEVSSAIRQDGYHLEGIACFVYDPGLNQPGTTPLFRLFNPNSGDHFYTTDQAEDQNAIANDGYQDEGIACHVYGLANAPGGTTPLYRLYNGM